MPRIPHSISMVYSLLQRLRSARHRFWYDVSEHVRWSRGAFHETPAQQLTGLSFEQAQRIAALRTRYQVQFERFMSTATAINNYEYLDILDRAFAAAAMTRPLGGELHDVGCASFWYAAALGAFFQPTATVGIDVEGYRLFKDGRTRIDYANGYLAALSDARFLVADYAAVSLPADVITAWFPFVTPAAILAWRLPLSLLQPQRLFQRIYLNLRPAGHFVMVNHGVDEAGVAENWCNATGLRCAFRSAEAGALSAHRPAPAVLSIWRRGPAA